MNWCDVLKTFLYNPTPQLVGATLLVLLVAMPIGANAWMVYQFGQASQRIESSVIRLTEEVRVLIQLTRSP